MEGRHLPLRAAVWGHTPDRFLRLPSDTSATGVAGPLPACVPDATAQAHAACHTFPNTSALRMNWRHLVYTDGSAPAAHNNRPGQPLHQPTKRCMGSGIYRPAGYTQGGNQEELCVRLDPAGHGITNTQKVQDVRPTACTWMREWVFFLARAPSVSSHQRRAGQGLLVSMCGVVCVSTGVMWW
jgi:hypothetical protein